MPNLDTIKTYLIEARDLAKLGLQIVPGANQEEKAAKLLGLFRPAIEQELTHIGASTFAVAFVDRLLEFAVDEAVKELTAA